MSHVTSFLFELSLIFEVLFVTTTLVIDYIGLGLCRVMYIEPFEQILCELFCELSIIFEVLFVIKDTCN